MSIGRFITLEGGEGTGKSTQAKRLAARLEARGLEAIVTREPGGAPGAEEIRALLVTGAPERWTPLSETLLLNAARAEHLRHVIRPALSAGKWVISDRFHDSTRAYQGIVGGVAPDLITQLETLVIGDTAPDLTLMLDLDPKAGLNRAEHRAGTETRFEEKGEAFHTALRQAFLDIAASDPGRCVVIASGGDTEQVANAIWTVVEQRFFGD